MTQYFNIMSWSHLDSDPYKAFVWSEDDDGYEKYGFLYSSSISGCLTQIEKELCPNEDGDDSFEIDVHVGDKHGGSSLIKSLEELYDAKLKYTSFLMNKNTTP